MATAARTPDRIRVIAFGLRGIDGIDGGIETHARELYKRLADRRCEVEVLTRRRYDATRRNARAAAGSVVTRALPAPPGKGLEAFVHALLAAAYCVFDRPDIVHVHGIGPAVLAPILRIFGVRVVVTHHGHDYDAQKWGPLARMMLRTGERIGVRGANAVITVSETLKRDVLEQYGVVCRTIYNGLPEKPAFVSQPSDRSLAALRHRKFVLVVGRITAHKRIDDVIAAFQSLPDDDIELVICGGAQARDPYLRGIEQAAERNPRIHLAGFVPPEQLPWLYENALCTVMASSYEGMPLAVLEALAFGSRLVLSDIPAHAEIGLDPCCYFPLGDRAALAARIAGLRAGGDISQTPRLPARIADRFQWSRIADETRAVFDEALRA